MHFLGLERLARWKRAEKFNLNPPKDVKELLEENRDNKAYGKRQGSYSLLFRGGGGSCLFEKLLLAVYIFRSITLLLLDMSSRSVKY